MFDSGGSTPVFYGQKFRPNDDDHAPYEEGFDVRISHPACYGFQFEVKKRMKKPENEDQFGNTQNGTQGNES